MDQKTQRARYRKKERDSTRVQQVAAFFVFLGSPPEKPTKKIQQPHIEIHLLRIYAIINFYTYAAAAAVCSAHSHTYTKSAMHFCGGGAGIGIYR